MTASLNPLEALKANVVQLGETDQQIKYNVLACRRAGYSWAKIARALGTTRQAAHKQYAKFCD